MTTKFSEFVFFVSDPESAATLMKNSLNCVELERFGDSWILLEAPGGGRFGYMKYQIQNDGVWPNPIMAFNSTTIEADVEELKSRGLHFSPVKKSETMWDATYTDAHGNRLLIWQDPNQNSPEK